MERKSAIVKKWQKHFIEIGLPPERYEPYLRYVGRIASRKVPPILDFSHLAALLGRTEHYLASAINATSAHYRVYLLPKRRGGKREISAPYPALLECQRWINKNVLRNIAVHDAAHGFVPDKSIISNAQMHINKAAILKMDFADFFPSIPISRVISLFQSLGYPPNISFYLARLCCLKDQIPQGAATSPALSNIIAYKFDLRISALSHHLGLTYTRYADDLTFSGNWISHTFPTMVATIAAEEGFRVRREKTHFCRAGGKRLVTGLSVSGERVRVPRQYRRELRQKLHYIETYGYISHVKKEKIFDTSYLESLLGKLGFWKHVDPGDPRIDDLLGRLKKIMNQIGGPI